eukprot:2841085-Rhodomonas_salina.1
MKCTSTSTRPWSPQPEAQTHFKSVGAVSLWDGVCVCSADWSLLVIDIIASLSDGTLASLGLAER